jgi:hypothetical protein
MLSGVGFLALVICLSQGAIGCNRGCTHGPVRRSDLVQGELHGGGGQSATGDPFPVD